jgi:hypothetical protein
VKLLSAASCQAADGCVSTPHYRSFYYPPTGAMVGQSLYLALGSGERNALAFTGTLDAQKNRFYVFKDLDPYERELPGSTSTARLTDTSSSSDFVDVSTLSGSCNPPVPGGRLPERPRRREVHHDLDDLLRNRADQLVHPTVDRSVRGGRPAFLYGFS